MLSSRVLLKYINEKEIFEKGIKWLVIQSILEEEVQTCYIELLNSLSHAIQHAIKSLKAYKIINEPNTGALVDTRKTLEKTKTLEIFKLYKALGTAKLFGQNVLLVFIPRADSLSLSNSR